MTPEESAQWDDAGRKFIGLWTSVRMRGGRPTKRQRRLQKFVYLSARRELGPRTVRRTSITRFDSIAYIQHQWIIGGDGIDLPVITTKLDESIKKDNH